MKHPDHVNLLRPAIVAGTGPWADLGSGDGAFTLALRDLLGSNAEIISIEKDKARLERQRRNFLAQFPESKMRYLNADFMRPLSLPPLEGIVMANVLHFFRDKESVLLHLRGMLKEKGRLVIVEYNVDSGNPWVPFPVSFKSCAPLVMRAGFTEVQLIGTAPSSFLGQFYSALAYKGSL